MNALGKVVRAGVGRRRVQTVAVLLTTLMAVTAAVLAAGLLVASRAPFDTAFAAQRGAELTAEYDAARSTEAQAAATAHVPGVTAAAGPYPVLSVGPHIGPNTSGMPVGQEMAPLRFVGRADAGGAVDALRLASGRWASGPGEVVLEAHNAPLDVGDQLAFPDLPGQPSLTVVGLAASMTGSADAWVPPATLARLTPPGARPDRQLLYRFQQAATDAQLAADRAALASAVPPGALGSVASYLTVRQAAEKSSATFVPFVTAFGALGLVMSVLVIAIVVGGSVSAATRRIGILKALGFTPDQVVRAYLAQALIPASAGTLLGVLLASLLAVPVLGEAATAYGTGPLTLAPWVELAVAGGALAAVAVAALVPALRGGRLRTVDALTTGRTPRAGRGRTVRALLGRLPLPRAVSLGLGGPFVRPGRSATMVTAVLLGSIGVTFALGLTLSLNGIQDGMNRKSPGSVVVQALGPPPAPVPGAAAQPVRKADPETVGALIAAQPGTRRYLRTGLTRVGVAGLAGPTEVVAYSGDSSWGAYQMVAGSWFDGPGQVVVPGGFLSSTGTRLGDTVTLTANGHQARVRIVGEAFATRPAILTDARSLDGLGAYVVPESVEFDIDLTAGTGRQGYVDALNLALAPYGITAQPNDGRLSSMALSMDTLAGTLALMLVAVAGLGVLNTVVLDTRERIRDFGIHRALGMAPRQTVTMILTSVAGIGLVAGLAGVPVGVALHDYVLPRMGRAAGTTIPAADLAVYHGWVVAPLLLAGLLMAVGGALLPAGWAARTGTAAALRTE
ncbi:FtsX-like permease family protein [Kitasatospora sp. NPDC053057]|uniref:FtsX-like permease family protein n=1 Tax=Kitasatospora sp. NPDC053057 TaxID=3364062 RepID=UPI0037CA0C1C